MVKAKGHTAVRPVPVRERARPEVRRARARSVFARLYQGTAACLDRTIGWHRLPTPLGLLVLLGLRDTMRRQNLFDTEVQPATNRPPLRPYTPEDRTARTADGTHNDPADPRMGMAGARFGRNIPIEATFPETPPQILSPNPREISRRLLTRTELIPATSVNALVSPWLQFMIRDWFSHGPSPKDEPWQIPLAADDPWPAPPMTVLRSRPDPTMPPGARPPTWASTETHWWDASQIYGSGPEVQRQLRTGQDGKLRVTPEGLQWLPDDPAIDPTQVPGFWAGLLMMHTLFTHEHNAICDRLRAEHPTWGDAELFQRARLINAALIAKIHTVEWTPAVISHPTTKVGLRANWWGLAGERVHRMLGRIGRGDLISGIPGSRTRLDGVPFALTEEFVAVYRMHPLVPDDFRIRSLADDHELATITLRDLAGPHAADAVQRHGIENLLYSFGTMHPGLVTLHNFPRFLQEFHRPDGHLQDLAATDILRTRELGVPRYNEFRRLLRLAPAKTFLQLTGDPATAREIEEIYQGDIEQVDLMIGMYAERRPQGFAFSDTAFRIFLLMATRRLNADRFLSEFYRPEVYTREGLAWVADNTMTSVLLRHYPNLRPALAGVPNAFMPWSHVADTTVP
ncbi:peroxidase family protein [Actinomadura alba]|uniref:Heme peroxidase n=1 Tax=Actinomadura alba TaxID=406431 RepID=A0ABR7LS60_9ACTN|nr:peroxidase family protein [Actinomadura alba]MBC6467320.1 heme peroxidase [Actinomadura alba]